MKKITAKANLIEKVFNGYRARVSGRELTDSEVRKVLKESRKPAERKAVWEGSKAVGPLVEADLKALVKLRNEAAHKLGFADYHKLQLHLNEQTQDEVFKLFDELDQLTREPFARLKREIDTRARRTKRRVDRRAATLALPGSLFSRSSRHFRRRFRFGVRQGRHSQALPRFLRRHRPADRRRDHAQRPLRKARQEPTCLLHRHRPCGDVRVLANIVPNEYWMGTMLHELGHSVYSSKNIPASVPYVLRTEAHILTTEGIAMLFERFSKDADWLQAMGVPVPDPAAFDKAGARMRARQAPGLLAVGAGHVSV